MRGGERRRRDFRLRRGHLVACDARDTSRPSALHLAAATSRPISLMPYPSGTTLEILRNKVGVEIEFYRCRLYTCQM